MLLDANALSGLETYAKMTVICVNSRGGGGLVRSEGHCHYFMVFASFTLTVKLTAHLVFTAMQSPPLIEFRILVVSLSKQIILNPSILKLSYLF